VAKKRDERDDREPPTCEGYVSEEAVRRYFTLDELLKEAEEPKRHKYLDELLNEAEEPKRPTPRKPRRRRPPAPRHAS
jgi:hypothetical protein